MMFNTSLMFLVLKACLVSANSWWRCTMVSHATQWAFLKRRQRCCTLKEEEECFWVTFPTVLSHASCRLMMSCYVPLSCLLSPERWNVYGGICQNTTNRAPVLVQYLPVHCLVTNSGFILPKWGRCRIISSTLFSYTLTWAYSGEWIMTDV